MTRRQLGRLLGGAFLLRVPDEHKALPSKAYPFDQLPIQTSDGNQFRSIMRGPTATGEWIEVHETTLPPGGTPHPPHRHAHSEMWLIREGTVEITINGRSHKLGTGSAAFASSNDLHGIRNASEVPAIYFVVAVGTGA